MPPGRRTLHPLAALLVGLLAIACSGPTATSPGGSISPGSPASPAGSTAAAGPTRIPLLVDAEDPVGTTRFLFAMLDGKGSSIGAPDLTVSVAFYDVAKSTTTPAVGDLPATFLWAIKDVRGIYEVHPTFTEAGDWIAEVSSSRAALTERTRVGFQVSATSSAPAIGSKAPDTVTPTLADAGSDLKRISTDTAPDPDFYKVSVHDALAAHTPFVLVFATPAFCRSAQCGPTLEGVKAVAKTESAMTFIHVEPYQMTFQNGGLQPIVDAGNNLQSTDVTNAWGILTEPWIFVVDRAGIVRASFAIVVSADELTKAIDAVK